MSRGKQLKTKIKQAMLEGLAMKLVIDEVANKIYWKEEAKKPIQVSLKEHLGKMIDRIDPLELTATIALTYVTYQGLRGLELPFWNVGFLITHQRYPTSEEIEEAKGSHDYVGIMVCFVSSYLVVSGKITDALSHAKGLIGAFVS